MALGVDEDLLDRPALARSPLDSVLALYRLPTPSVSPELGAIFALLAPKKAGRWQDLVREIDAALVAAGL